MKIWMKTLSVKIHTFIRMSYMKVPEDERADSVIFFSLS